MKGHRVQGPVSRSSRASLKLDFLTNAMHLLYALVRKSSFSEAQGFVKPAPGDPGFVHFCDYGIQGFSRFFKAISWKNSRLF